MQTIEPQTLSGSALIQCPESGTVAPPVVGYEATRFNSMKHGILSKLVVLAHEDADEFTDLLSALIEEHQPAGITEQQLIEKLAAIIWRKRRVLLAEGASINRGLQRVAQGQVDSPIPAATPFQRGPAMEKIYLSGLMLATPEEVSRATTECRV